MVFQYSGLGPAEFLEIFIVLLHPFAPLHNIPWWGDEKWGLLMFLRFYMIFRVMRDYSTIFRERKRIGKMYIKHRPPKFNWFLSLKTYHYQNPLLTMTVMTVFCILIFGHITYVFERETPDTKFTYGISLYVAFICMVSGWPADPFGIYNTVTIFGMLAGVGCCLTGLVLLAQLLDMLMSQVNPTPHDRPAIMWVAHYDVKRKLRDTAARLIQLVYRKHKQHVKLTPRQFFQRYISLSNKFQFLIREVTSMEVVIEETEQATTLFDMAKNDL